MDRHPMQQTLSGRATPRERRRDMAAGARAMAPWLVGIVPYGLVIGVSAARSDVPTVAAWLTAPLIFAGSAQVAVIDLLGRGAAPVVVIVAALAINLRPSSTPRRWRRTGGTRPAGGVRSPRTF